MNIIDTTKREGQRLALQDLPFISDDEATAAANVVEIIRDKYDITTEDMNMLYSGMILVFIRSQYCHQIGYTPSGEDRS